MKAFRFPLFSFLLAFVLALPMAVHAGKKEKPAPEPTGPPLTKIAAIETAAITIHEGRKITTYKVTPTTEVLYKGEKTALKNLKPGMVVSVTAGTGTEATTATRITAEDAPADNSGGGKKKKKK